MTKDLTPEYTNFLLYTTPNGNISIEAFLHNETIWLTQKRISELFNIDRTVLQNTLKIFLRKKNR